MLNVSRFTTTHHRNQHIHYDTVDSLDLFMFSWVTRRRLDLYVGCPASRSRRKWPSGSFVWKVVEPNHLLIAAGILIIK